VKDDSIYAKKFTALIKKLCKAYKPTDVIQLEPTTQIIISFMEWNATNAMAIEAHDLLMQSMVDLNDVRVSLPQEIVGIIGQDYPLAEERACRMHETLNELFNREHDIIITSLKGKNKKQIKSYLETFPGITPYVIAQILLLSYGGHAVPVDDHMLALLKDEQVVHEDCTLAEAESFCERHIKAAEALHCHLAMRAWADEYELMIPEMSPISAPASPVKLAPSPKPTAKTEKSSAAAKTKSKPKTSDAQTTAAAKSGTSKTTKKTTATKKASK
jgi:endonuclease III